jgi:2'-5' RNA ligase
MYTIVALLPQNLVAALEPHRRKYDPQAHIIPPHITVIEPFNFSGSIVPLYSHLEEIGETHAPIRVSLLGWDAYTQSDYQLHLPLVTGRLEFTALRNNLMTGPLADVAKREKPYWPHITLGRFASPEDLDRAKQALKGFEAQFTFGVSSLELLYRRKSIQPWETQQRLKLEGTVMSLPRNREFIRTI